MKYYIGDVNIRCGDYIFTSTIKFKCEKNPNTALDKIAKEFYEDTEEDGDFFSVNGGELLVKANGYSEISEEVFEAIERIVEL